MPIRKRQSEAPKGSSITPRIPFSINSEEAPMMVSDPNQVANKPDVTTKRGSFLPATAKSLEVFTFFEASHPITNVAIR